MNSGGKFSLSRRENQCCVWRQLVGIHWRSYARICQITREPKVVTVNDPQTKRLTEHERHRDFLCVVRDSFRVFARQSSIILGSAWAFAGAVLVIAVWSLTGPTFHFSDTWQLIINTATTVITFLMVFLIQNTQNRDAKAVHLKLDEIIRAVKGARNELVDLEELSDEDLKKLEKQFQRIRRKAEHDGNHRHHVAPTQSRGPAH